MISRVSAAEAHALCEREGYVVVDVRSIPEFEAGHPKSAFNVPLLHQGPAGMTPNPEFLLVMARAFPKTQKLVLACRSGNRSYRAAEAMQREGWLHVVDQRAGWISGTDAAGQRELGWPAAGLPVAQGDGGPERSYAALSRK